ncbi:MAG: peptidoglycan-binding protein [Deltaproteobacteria bacterium]|nr:peptidoglycan-binding protein [Deltaproteobacteria bacterium]
MLSGIDVSSAQGDVDFNLVRNAGFRFCIAKATEGADFRDKRFQTNMQKIAAVEGGPRFFAGAYHFARPDNRAGRNGGEVEAKWFCSVLKQSLSSVGLSITNDFIEPVLDMEKYDESDASDNISWVEGFLSVIAAETGRTGMVYTGPNYWRYQAGNTDQFAKAGIPLWEVKYSRSGANEGSTPPRLPTDTRKALWTPSLWQWSGGGDFAYYVQQYGKIPGVPSGVADVDRVMGDESVLRALAKASSDATVAVDSAPLSMPAPMPPVDISGFRGRYNATTARVQGLLLSQGYGPQGLISSSTGTVDGIGGPSTEAALQSFKGVVGLPADTVVDTQTWWMLVHRGLD